MLFICVCGSVSLTCDNGSERATYHLSSPDVAVHTEPGIWVELSEFAKGAVLLVLSSLSYAEARYFDLPMFNELAAVPRDGGE